MDDVDVQVRAYMRSDEFVRKLISHQQSSPQTKMAIDTLREQVKDLKVVLKEGFQGVYKRQDKTNGKVMANTKYRIGTEAVTKNIKWLLGFFGVGNVALMVYVLVSNLK